MAFTRTARRDTCLPDAAGEHDEASLQLEGGVDTLERAYINLTGWNGRNADRAQLQRVGGAWEKIRIRQC